MDIIGLNHILHEMPLAPPSVDVGCRDLGEHDASNYGRFVIREMVIILADCLGGCENSSC